MCELLLLFTVLGKITEGTEEIEFNGRKYNVEMIKKRLDVLLEEFLEPYVIDSTSKE